MNKLGSENQSIQETHGLIQTVSLKEFKHKMKEIFNDIADLVEHTLTLKTRTEAVLYYFEGLTDNETLKSNVISPLLQCINDNFQAFDSDIISAHTKKVISWDEIIQEILQGKSVLFIEGHQTALIINTSGGWAERAVQEPTTEVTVKGSHDGFIENASKNLGIIRRYVPSIQLKTKKLMIGARASTAIYLIYLGDVANEGIIQEAERRIQNINADTVLDAGELSNLIKDQKWTPFPQAYLSERPDAIAQHILEGKVVILVDRSPSAMVIPIDLIGFFRTPDDYNLSWLVASSFRLLRFFGFITAIFLPSIYIASVSFHFEIIPLDLYLSIASSRIKVPFPPLMEALIMEITLEMLREAGVRLPQPIGQTIGIVGGIVIGQAAVQAGIVSNIMVIIVSITAISSFVVSNYDLIGTIRLIRFPMMLLGYIYGFVGIVCGSMILIAHFVTLTSFGTPYSIPITPFRIKNFKDSFIRFPIHMLTTRSSTGQPKQEQKRKNN
ncbi:spore germination protein [Bacillus thuringiensis]|uniref:Spore germination protein n=1 Tax=Bacillus thuringiensis TaxID=1428 RepID=A0A9X7BVX8_BACTU|nr:spore germination protein [Bacillus thuringiensis]PGH79727.1 spore germination protein [Bacillus thuringiensis]